MGLRRIGSDYKKNPCVLKFTNGVSHGSRAKHGRQTGDRWGVSGASTVVDIVCSDHRPHELHHGIVVFIRISRAG